MNVFTMNKALKGVLVALVILFSVGLFYADKRLQAVALNTKNLKAEIEIENKKIQNYELTKLKIAQLEYVKDAAHQILPKDENQSVIVAELTEFAKRSNLSTGAINFTDEKQTQTATTNKDTKPKSGAPEGVRIVPVIFEVSEGAAYSDVLDFLNYIEQNRRKMQVTQISLTPNPDDGARLNDVSIGINLFVKDDKAENE